MRIKLFFLAVIFLPATMFSQWSKVNSRGNLDVKEAQVGVEVAQIYSLDLQQMQKQLSNVSDRDLRQSGVVIRMPNANGELERFEVWEASNFEAGLQEKYPMIRSYIGKGLDDATAVLRFSLSHKGLSSMKIYDGKTVFIEPYTNDHKYYIVFDSTDHRKSAEDFACEVMGSSAVDDSQAYSTEGANAAGDYREFRLALSCTGEYGVYHGGTVPDVLAAFNASMTRINGVLEKDLSIHFNLIDRTEELIFLNPNTDPYSGAGPDQANSVISSKINDASAYDMGHLVDKKGANGAAYLGVLCGGSLKAGGWTAHNIPEGATFDIDYVAHEMGHQMGAGHSFSFDNWQIDRTVEPGSGNTIMAYTGITGNLDVQGNSYDYYHAASIAQIKNRLNQVPTCGNPRTMTVQAPVINAGPDRSIPHSTPFVLKGQVSGEGVDNFTHNWEQIDLAPSSQFGTNSKAYPTKPSGPNFKSEKPVAAPERYFPQFSKVLGGVLSTTWESVSSITRPLNFAMTTRNNHSVDPQSVRDDIRINVTADAGPFVVTSPIADQNVSSLSNVTITWDVANTNVAPVNTTHVNIKLSTDGGISFVSLLDGTANDGSETVSIPAGSQSENAYILIEAVDNVFYAVSPSFVIDYAVIGEECETYTYSGPAVSINDGPGGSEITSKEITIPLDVINKGGITKFSVNLDVTHPNVRHLNIGLEAPYGTRALIWNRSCSGRSDIKATFEDNGSAIACNSPVSGNFLPNETLNVFKGMNPTGEWRLFAADNMPGGVGQVNAWSMEICTRKLENLGLMDFANQKEMKIYPNPSKGEFFVNASNVRAGNVSTVIYDATGRKVHQSNFDHKGGQLNQKYSLNLPVGVYVVMVQAVDKNMSQKLIVK